MRLYLGIDGGQSSTTALIADDAGRVLGLGHGGPCNHVGAAEGRSKFFGAISASLAEACSAAGLKQDDLSFAAACLGFSGGAKDKEVYSRELIRSARYKITHDAEIALAGATGGEPGIIAIAGTGSMAFGMNQDDRTARAGGWGYIFGDEGGAFDLTRRALRAALQFEEGWGPETRLLPSLLKRTGATSANQLLHRFYADMPRRDIAALAPLVSEAAEQKDAVALQILETAASRIAWYVEGVYRNLFGECDIVPVAFVGGVFRSKLMLREFESRVGKSIECPVITPKLSPAAGAVLEALRMDGNGSTLSAVPESEK
jgi:N-acetylglucosamine kinase-like BadF-type ATPase